MKSVSLRMRLVVGLIAVVAVGLTVAEMVTYYSVRSFMLKRVDEQVEASSAPAMARLGLEQRFEELRDRTGTRNPEAGAPPSSQSESPDESGPLPGQFGSNEGAGGPFEDATVGGRPSGTPPNFTASIPPGTYAELRIDGHDASATSFGFEESYPIPRLPAEVAAETDGKHFTVGSIESSARFRVSVTSLAGGQGTLLVAVPMTEFDKTMERLQFVGIGVSAAVLVALAAVSFWLVKLGLRPLDDFALTAASIAEGDMSQRVRVTNDRTEIGRLGRAMNEMLEDLEEAFARRHRSEEQLRRFLADASHELRTPLTSIRGYAELFGRGASARPDDLDRAMKRITQQSERMSLIVEDLLLLARLGQDRQLEFETVDLREIAAEVVEEALMREPRRTIAFESGGPIDVIGDAGRLYRALDNLVSNALTHTSESAVVQVSVRVAGDAALLEVCDDGPGIAEADREHVFEPFYRASASRARKDGGSGLGLAIVKAIVEAHDGSVEVREVQPRGVAFAVSLPAASLRRGSSRSALNASASDPQPRKDGRVAEQPT